MGKTLNLTEDIIIEPSEGSKAIVLTYMKNDIVEFELKHLIIKNRKFFNDDGSVKLKTKVGA